MTALAQGVQRPELSDSRFDFGPQKGSTIIYKGSLVMPDGSGFLRPAAAGVAGATFCVGVAAPRDWALDRYDATGLADGAVNVEYEMGAFGFKNDGTNPILSTTQPGTPVFAVDDQTVSLSSLNGTRPFAGRLRELDPTAIGGPVVVHVSKDLGAQLGFGAGLDATSPDGPDARIRRAIRWVATAAPSPTSPGPRPAKKTNALRRERVTRGYCPDGVPNGRHVQSHRQPHLPGVRHRIPADAQCLAARVDAVRNGSSLLEPQQHARVAHR
jgi:hypothetical protein